MERAEVERLISLKHLPITSQDALALMIGINPGLVWSFVARPRKYYDQFPIKKGSKVREILAPRVSLKVVQKWISYHLQSFYSPPEHVYGFVAGRSHIDAASVHCGAEWVFSVDIENFFPTTPSYIVKQSLQKIGYGQESSSLIASLCTLDGFLVQGSPCSPVISNIVFEPLDATLAALATEMGARLTRYADDIVFSGSGEVPEDIRERVRSVFNEGPWSLSERKSKLSKHPERLKVHGLLVHNSVPRLTKGYRNKIRAFRHSLLSGKVKDCDMARITGHVQYADHVSNKFRGSAGL